MIALSNFTESAPNDISVVVVRKVQDQREGLLILFSLLYPVRVTQYTFSELSLGFDQRVSVPFVDFSTLLTVSIVQPSGMS